MTGPSTSGITQLLDGWLGGDQLALQHLTPVVYKELRHMAQHYMARVWLLAELDRGVSHGA
jgi:hypothetical protein